MGSSNENDKEILPLYRGGGKIDYIKLSDWTEESASYFSRFYAKRLIYNGIICIPQDGPYKDNIMKTLKEWCLMGSLQHALLVQNVDLSKHWKLLKNRESDFMSFKSPIDRPQCYLAYNFNENIILYLCRAKDNEINKNFEKLMSHCRSNLHLLVNVYQDELKMSDVKIIGLVISNSESQNFQLKCKLCKMFVIPLKSFESSSTFHSWLEKFTRWFGISEFTLHQRNSKIFSSFCAKMLSLMACTRCKYMPNFTSNVTSQMEQACLLLNPEQMEILYSSCNFVILKGNFGTGKTILLQKKLEDLAPKLTKNQIIYYINYDPKSKAYVEVKHYIENIFCTSPNRIIILENKNGLQMSGIFQLISNKVGKSMKSVHVFIDEYNGEDLTQSEVDILKTNLKAEHFQDSSIFIASQPMEKVRIDAFPYSFAVRKSGGNLFHKLKDIFIVEELTYVMRTTVQVNIVMELLQKYLQNKQNEFIHFLFNVSATPIQEASLNAPIDSQAGYSLQNNENQFLDSHSLSSGMPTGSSVLEGVVANSPSEPSLYSSLKRNKSFDLLDFNSKENVKVLDFSPKKDMDSMHGGDDLDVAFKEASKLEANDDKAANKLKTITSYTYIRQSEIGHKIESLNPKLILPYQSGNTFEVIVSYSAILHSLGISRQKFVIIHFEQSPPSVLIKALNVAFKSVNLSLSVSMNVQDFISKNVYTLVTNFRHVRGMEFENVILLVDSEEYFLKHYLPEAIARCTSNLSLIMLQGKRISKKEETVKEIVGLLQQQEPAVVEIWITRKCEKCTQRSRYYCSKKEKCITHLGINILSDEFEKMKEYSNPTLPAALYGAMTVTDVQHM